MQSDVCLLKETLWFCYECQSADIVDGLVLDLLSNKMVTPTYDYYLLGLFGAISSIH